MKVYSFFHLNLAYSSIEEEQRSEVIKKCYWPLLNLVEELQVPAGIESSAYTLQSIADIDSTWLVKIKELIKSGLVEFIGSGYAQIIGPLIPARVNAANLRLGNKAYENLLGVKPQTALINEQVYSSGLVQLYKNAGYQAIIMEWNNPAHYHIKWDRDWQYYPQYASGNNGEQLPLIWNNSLAFQKFQRYVHGEMELEEYLDYLNRFWVMDDAMFPLYGNDVEIFDFRPGRYHTEALLNEKSEWQRIRQLFEALKSSNKIDLVIPGKVLSLFKHTNAGNLLSLQSSQQPIPVKKQAKYNITRWAVTGRDDLGINTACYNIYHNLLQAGNTDDADWQELCYLWSSDFRTHITQKRWDAYKDRLQAFKEKTSITHDSVSNTIIPKNNRDKNDMPTMAGVNRQGRYLTANTSQTKVEIDCQRGLTIKGLWQQQDQGSFWCGTLPHGFYNDIAMDFDWYTGHSVIECLGNPKITDLNPIDPEIRYMEDCEDILISGKIPTTEGVVEKTVRVFSSEPAIGLEYIFRLGKLPAGSFRLGHITLNPQSFDQSSLFYKTCNGGFQEETFMLEDNEFDFGSPVSFLVSANHCLGITEGWLEIGDRTRVIRIEVDKTLSALVGLISYRKVNDGYFLRVSLSAGEWDETRRLSDLILDDLRIRIKIKLIYTNNARNNQGTSPQIYQSPQQVMSRD